DESVFLSESIVGCGRGEGTSCSAATDGLGPGRPRSRGRGRRCGPAVRGKGQITWIECFSHFVKTRVAACFCRVEGLLPSFELLRRNIVMPGTIHQIVGPD